MKYIIFSLISLNILLSTACNKDDDKIHSRNDFVGEYDGVESTVVSNQTITQDHTFTIVLDSIHSDGIIIQNFGVFNKTNIPATVAIDSFHAAPHALLINGQAGTMIASGALNGNTLSYKYTLTSPTLVQTWEGTAAKK